MKNIELERAWPAPKAPPGFTDRVVERLQRAQTAVEPRAPGPGQSRKLTPLRSSWLALPILALVLGGVLLLWPFGVHRRATVRSLDVLRRASALEERDPEFRSAFVAYLE